MSAYLDRASNLKSCHLANIREALVAGSDHREHGLIQLSGASEFRGRSAHQIDLHLYQHGHRSGSWKFCQGRGVLQFLQHLLMRSSGLPQELPESFQRAKSFQLPLLKLLRMKLDLQVASSNRLRHKPLAPLAHRCAVLDVDVLHHVANNLHRELPEGQTWHQSDVKFRNQLVRQQ